MKKQTYFIFKRFDGIKGIDTETGYVYLFHGNAFGINQRGTGWYITDITSGTLILPRGAKLHTLKEAVDFLYHSDYMNKDYFEIVEGLWYRETVKNFNAYLAAECVPIEF
jgi:hypothetical protein